MRNLALLHFTIFITSGLLPAAEINLPEITPRQLARVNEFTQFLNNNDIDPSLKQYFSRLNLEKLPTMTETQFTVQSFANLPPLSDREVDFNYAAAAHLLRRTAFGPTVEEINSSLDLQLSGSVAGLLQINPLPNPPGNWINEPIPEDVESYSQEQIDSLITLYYYRMHDMRNWWLDLMINDEANVREMMVLFWHDHFATSTDKIIFPPAMYHQIDLIREQALGNFKTLAREMCYDPAMLIWLDNNQNTNEAINENFARELLELFTIGIGNYTQEDIIEAARAFTGWVTDGLNIFFVQQWHDFGEKTFMGQTGNWNGDDIIDVIFQQDETARFICRKLYKWFVYYNPDEAVVEELALIMRENDYEIKPVLEALFSSEHFYDENFRGAKYRGPIYFTTGTVRQLYIDDEPFEPGQQEHILLLYFQELFGQLPLFPPDVSGWPGYRTWINTYSLPYRKLLTNGLVDGYIYDFDLGFRTDVVALAERMSDPNDPYQLIEDLCQYLYSIQPSQTVKVQLVQEMLDGSEAYDWSIYQPEAAGRLRTVLKHILRLGEYQLR